MGVVEEESLGRSSSGGLYGSVDDDGQEEGVTIPRSSRFARYGGALMIVGVGLSSVQRVSTMTMSLEAVSVDWDAACEETALASCGSDQGDPAIAGTDVVAYFTSGTVEAGSASFVADYGVSRYYFSSEANLDAFRVSPEAYAPRLGGFCAYQLSGADLESHNTVLCDIALDTVDPSVFYMHNGSLYLFKGATALEEMLKGDLETHFETAELSWSKVAPDENFVNSNSAACTKQVTQAWMNIAKAAATTDTATTVSTQEEDPKVPGGKETSPLLLHDQS